MNFCFFTQELEILKFIVNYVFILKEIKNHLLNLVVKNIKKI